MQSLESIGIAVMPISLRIPAALQSLTAGKHAIECEGATVRELIDNADAAHPGLKRRLCDASPGSAGGIARFVKIYVNDDDIAFLKGLDTPLQPGDEVLIVPPIAGG